MSKTLSRQREAAPPIRALIIQPDNSYEVREIEQDIRTLQGLVGGHFETFSTEYCILWFNKHDSAAQPCNAMATYLWWKLCPEMEARGSFCGAVFVTGLADEDTGAETAPVPDEVVELYERMEQIRQEIEAARERVAVQVEIRVAGHHRTHRWQDRAVHQGAALTHHPDHRPGARQMRQLCQSRAGRK